MERQEKVQFEEIDVFEKNLATRSAYMPAFTATLLKSRANKLRNKLREEERGGGGEEGAVVVTRQEVETFRRGAETVIRQSEIQLKQSERCIAINGEIGSNDDSLTVSNARETKISLSNVSKTVFIKNVANSSISLGPCSGAVFLEDVVDCEIWLAAHQIRLVACNNLKMHIHVTTNVILEDCFNVKVEPLSLWYDGMENDMKEARLTTENRFDNLVNFTDL